MGLSIPKVFYLILKTKAMYELYGIPMGVLCREYILKAKSNECRIPQSKTIL